MEDCFFAKKHGGEANFGDERRSLCVLKNVLTRDDAVRDDRHALL
jgi:hypothetical protein